MAGPRDLERHRMPGPPIRPVDYMLPERFIFFERIIFFEDMRPRFMLRLERMGIAARDSPEERDMPFPAVPPRAAPPPAEPPPMVLELPPMEPEPPLLPLMPPPLMPPPLMP